MTLATITKWTLRFVLSSSMLLSFGATASTSIEQSNERLAKIKQQIEAQTKALDAKIAEKSTLDDQFKRAELKVSQLVIALKQTQNKLKDLNEKNQKLKQEQTKLQLKQAQQQSILAEMVKTAYLNGKHDYTKLLLNQNDPAQLERLIIYYRRLNDARTDQIEEIQYTLSRLSEIEKELAAQRQLLFELKQQQDKERQALNAEQKTRKRTLAQLQKRIKSDGQKLAQLEENQKRLTQAIENAQRNAAPRLEDLAGLYNLKKKLKWPTRGRLLKSYGQRRQGSMRWKGALIDGQLGNPVNAIASGIVLYADWLKGFGWVTIVDHGKGYMSLYGYNQALLKQVGDFVEAQEPLALVGQSGGRSSAELYFEIRYKGKTVDPARWCR
jgi:murein hydrolase activator